jgi:hypothetical protein
MRDLDKVQAQRIDDFWDKYKKNSSWSESDIFLSDGVLDTLHSEKALVAHYHPAKILSLLPFTPTVYVELCKNCFSSFTDTDFKVFSALVRKRAIIPVLLNSYSEFPDPITDLVKVRDHISGYEYRTYRWLSLFKRAEGAAVCIHCAKRRENDIRRLVKRRSNFQAYDLITTRVFANLYPFVNDDFQLINLLYDLSKRRDIQGVARLEDLSFAIHEIRSTQAFHAQFVIDSETLDNIPEELSPEDKTHIDFSANVKKQIGDGFGLRIPMGSSVEQYIEIAQAFQPRISSIVGAVLASGSNTNKQIAMERIIKKQMEMNAEVDRIAGLKRYLVLETAIDFFSKNKALAATTLIAGALGLITGVTGCATGAAGAVLANVAKKRGWIKESQTSNKMIRTIKNDVQPYIDNLIAKYTRSYVPAVSILTLRKDLAKSQPTDSQAKRTGASFSD